MGGDITIVCQGVSPKALERLNELLDKKDIEFQTKIQEAETWAQKYRELHGRLGQEGQDDILSQTAKTLLEEGKLEEAGAILGRLIASGKKRVKQVAAHHFNRAEVYTLQFQPYNALPHYEKAYRYRSDNAKYAFQYAFTLQKQNHHTKAQTVYQEALGTYRKLANANPQAYLSYVAQTLNSLGILYSDTQRLSDSEQAFKEALGTYRKLANANPQAYLPDVANTFNNLGFLYSNTQRLSDSEQAYQEALGTYRKLANANPQAYLSYVAQTLNSLGILYSDTQRLSDSEQAYQEALGIRRKLANANPQAYLPDVAQALNNLAVLYSDTQRLSDSEQAFKEALGMYRKLADANPQAYLPYVASTLNNLAILELAQDDIEQARGLVSEVLTIRRDLYKKHARAYGNDLAQSLAIEVMVLLRTEKETSLACPRLQEMSNVAVSEGLQQWAKERAKDLCDKAADGTTIGKK